jgi:hypothetical protein
MRHEEFMKQMAKAEDDNVNNPSHYNSAGVECIQAIEAALSPEELRGYYKGNILKYTWREQYKNKDEDLKKANWYLSRLVGGMND